MNNVVNDFTGLLKEMESSLISNDVEQINKLTVQQQICLSEIVRCAEQDPELKKQLVTAMPTLLQQLKVNETLLNQAITLSNSLITTLHKGISTRTLDNTSSCMYTA
jgi:hypothetical protein